MNIDGNRWTPVEGRYSREDIQESISLTSQADLRSQADLLANELEKAIQPFVNQELMIGGYRNSAPVIMNMLQALKKFSQTGDFNANIDPENANGQGSSSQPDSVRDTFQQALNVTCYGGLRQTKEFCAEEPDEHHVNVARKLEEIVKFLQSFMRKFERN